MCCSVLQRVAVCCSVLQCVVVCCSVLQCVAVCCSVLQRVAVCCSVLQCVAVCCSVLQHVAVCCSVLQRAFNKLQRVLHLDLTRAQRLFSTRMSHLACVDDLGLCSVPLTDVSRLDMPVWRGETLQIASICHGIPLSKKKMHRHKKISW